MNNLSEFLSIFWPILLPSILGLAGVYLLMPRVRRYPPLWGGVCSGLALAALALLLIRTEARVAERILFYAFSGIAIVSGGLMITLRNPVYSALSFAMVVLSTCGLFLLQAAPFLMAATIIIYAGAIVVTFLFVIMLAQQAGISDADQRSREPFLATVGGFVLLACLLAVLQRNYDTNSLDQLLGRMDMALEQKDKVEMAKALDGAKEFSRPGASETAKALDAVKEFTQQLRKATDKANEPADKHKRLLGGTSDQRLKLNAALDDFDEKFTDDKSKFDEVVAELDKVRQSTLQLRVSVGGLVPNKDLPLSKFSGGTLAEPVPLDPHGYVKDRMPANNVAALGKSLFSDYLLPLEMAGMLLLVATIGAIVIAGRRSEVLR